MLHKNRRVRQCMSARLPGQITPLVVRSGTQLGTVCRQAAAMTSIPEGRPIIAGMTDRCAAQIGAGALDADLVPEG